MLLWNKQPEEADADETFELQANGVDLTKLDYLSPDFKLIEDKI